MSDRLDHLTGQHRQTPPARKYFAMPSLEKPTKGVGKEVRWSKVSTVDETPPAREDPDERSERRHRWYRPYLVG